MKNKEGLISYFLTVYLLFVLTTVFFLLKISSWDGLTLLVILPALFFYPLLAVLPGALISAGANKWMEKFPGKQLPVTGAAMFLTVFPVHLFLLLDAGLFFRYGYHVNPHVINIFTTPGGFEGMGMRGNEFLMLILGLAALLIFHAALVWGFLKVKAMQYIQLRSWWYLLAVPPAAGLLFLISGLTYAYAHYTMQPPPLRASNCIPFYIPMTSGSFFKSIGVPKPSRDTVLMRLSKQVQLKNYPDTPIIRKADRPKYNVIWLACESWAARLYSPELMPRTTEFAKQGVTFKKHYSGGNVTRQGVFSMFYALPGSYWHPFLAVRKGPLFIDWLKEDGYSFKCITSSKFTYPEFDQTVFAALPQSALHSDSNGKTFERDQRNLKLLLSSIREGADSGKPFFRFMFFESSHHPYEFPPEAVVYKDYIDPFNAVSTTAADGPAIFRRAANTARHLDMLLARIFDLLKEKDLMKNTIVVLAGDHGEEYYEKGLLGHSSRFNNEQTMTTLILYYPGIKPGVYTQMSSHLDIVPMLAGLFGVQNPSRDDSCGFDLLSPQAPRRRYAVIANWSDVFFAGEKYKSYIPLDVTDFISKPATDADDKELPDNGVFYKEYGKDLIQLQKDLTRFTSDRN